MTIEDETAYKKVSVFRTLLFETGLTQEFKTSFEIEFSDV